MNFDFDGIRATTFGVCTRQSDDVHFFDVPVASGVRTATEEMARSTMDAMRDVSEDPAAYEPSERYSGPQHLRVELDDPIAAFSALCSKLLLLSRAAMSCVIQERFSAISASL